MKGIIINSLYKTFDEAIPNIQISSSSSSSSSIEPLQENEVRIKVKAASINYFDLLMLVGKYQYKPKLPFVLLTEAAGIVSSVGSKATKFKIGDRVMFSTGVQGAGCEELVLPEHALHRLPAKLTFGQGAGFLMGYKTAYHGLVHRGAIRKDEWCLVTGAGGGMGMAAVQLAKALGAKVIACASDDEKLKACKQAGADYIINYGGSKLKSLKDEVDKITNGEFVDIIYDPVGGDVFDQCVRCVSTKGGARLLVIGFAEGRIPTLPVNMALIKGFSLVGVRMGAQMIIEPELNDSMEKELVRMAENGLLTPVVSKEFPIEQAKEALKFVSDRKVIGKTVVTFNPSISKL